MISRKQLRLPATAEFIARCGVTARKRLLGTRDRGPAPLKIHRERTTPDQLAAAFEQLGIHPGSDLMVHSDSNAIQAAGWTPSDMIDFLLDYVGTDGTLLMPSHPKLKRVSGKLIYNVRRSPSQVGLMTELFRRRKQSLRSHYPWSAVAAIGLKAEHFLTDHIHSYAPHDEHSPYAKLADAKGHVICLGCDLDRMTVLHVAEDRKREQLGIRQFYSKRYAWVMDGEHEQQLIVHRRSPWLWFYLNLSRWNSDMYRYKIATDTNAGGLEIRAAQAARLVFFMESEIAEGRSLYPLAKMNRWLKLQNPALEAA